MDAQLRRGLLDVAFSRRSAGSYGYRIIRDIVEISNRRSTHTQALRGGLPDVTM